MYKALESSWWMRMVDWTLGKLNLILFYFSSKLVIVLFIIIVVGYMLHETFFLPRRSRIDNLCTTLPELLLCYLLLKHKSDYIFRHKIFQRILNIKLLMWWMKQVSLATVYKKHEALQLYKLFARVNVKHRNVQHYVG